MLPLGFIFCVSCLGKFLCLAYVWGCEGHGAYAKRRVDGGGGGGSLKNKEDNSRQQNP